MRDLLEILAGRRDISLPLKNATVVTLNMCHVSGFHSGPQPEIFFADRGRYFRLSFGAPIRLREAVSDGGKAPQWTDLDLVL
ncbi:hypothetical protein A2389_02740 [Candidatus Adlerbacteria bacterium RIFOXYB1_FULL_48_10]|nr:MAG: hypothetical protein A2389_02740 [Candidatus Adlerbacteria bacterium RIFOXYB1_FULL_48_10]OGC96243.1 MAG: hypothetical protein A2590_02075 [Candidatus Adlerbacteria bacterium RIFOXYD1_FULL_48_8]